ncbi:MAG: hypothetical protein KAS93_06025 [Gammaproteobacteria bacterium]|nr:hypothetical protein [Gammaproteobacteria bacterium]
MLSIFRKVQINPGVCSFTLSPEGIAFVYIKEPHTKPIQSSVCGLFSCDNNRLLEKCLAEIVAKNNLENTACNWVLLPHQYRLLLVDRPNVPEAEYKSALRWQIKDMIDFPVEDLALDVFLPSSEIADYHKKLYVVAAQRKLLLSTISAIQGAQLFPGTIDVTELAMRNLLPVIADQNHFVSFIYVMESVSVLIIAKNNSVYFARHIELGKQKLVDPFSVDSFVAEVKRSYDYCQHQLKQDLSASKIILSPLAHNGEVVAKKLNEVLKVDVSILDINNYFTKSKGSIPVELQEYCVSAAGGALREEGK